MKIALAQINCTVGDLTGNSHKIIEYYRKARSLHADIVVFPELAITGYPPEDLLLKPRFIADNIHYLKKIAKGMRDIPAVIGFADSKEKNRYNAAAFISKGKISKIYHKMVLPNYGVFDEKRYFKPGNKPAVISLNGMRIGIAICEDVWQSEGPVSALCRQGVKLVIVLNASPYHTGKIKQRQDLISSIARKFKVHMAYSNLIGAQDELVFDGFSMVADPQGRITARAQGFNEELLIADILPKESMAPAEEGTKKADLPSTEEEVYEALQLGLRDYVIKNGFGHVVIGLSGGIDSALVATVAKDAVGKKSVHAVFMPSVYSSQESFEDAKKLADNLGIDFRIIPIDDVFKSYASILKEHFRDKKQDITEENLQARIRGNILMALSNKFGWLVITTGNKSEMSTGYATLYGDMAGGFALIKDVPKTLVWRLARYRNSINSVIPERIITKEPTAELRLNQKDSDSLPKYETLDPILKLYIEELRNPEAISKAGFKSETVAKVLNLVDKSEYKRRQAPPGVKITPRAFGRDRRMPITNRYGQKAGST
ncbi:MAG: NAD+ synthase [Endomicrobiales bacterium]|nr:NAD+ synthase [Endomicrobiales bacterium]